MKRMHKTRVELFNSKMKELTGKEECIFAEIYIDINEIIAVREASQEDDGDINPDICAVYMRSGEFFTLHTPYKNLLNLMGLK